MGSGGRWFSTPYFCTLLRKGAGEEESKLMKVNTIILLRSVPNFRASCKRTRCLSGLGSKMDGYEVRGRARVRGEFEIERGMRGGLDATG